MSAPEGFSVKHLEDTPFESEGVGEVRLRPGSCVHQRPGIRHWGVERSDDVELIEITLPAEFGTSEAEAP